MDRSMTQVLFNGLALDEATLGALQSAYQAQIPAGSYWYDALTGLWGLRGGPSAGQIHPGLALGGPLAADASGGGTGVYINGRELHPMDVANLQQMFGAVPPGRFWLNAEGLGGYEGGPPLFNLRAAAAAQQPGGPGYNRSTLGGHLGSDGQNSYWFDPKTGASVMTGDG